MTEHHLGRRGGVGLSVAFAVAILVVCALPGAWAQPTLAGPAASLQVSIVVSPSPVTVGTQFNVSAQVSGGSGPYSYVWSNVPNGCNAQPTAWWFCSLSNAGQYSVSVTVSNSTGAQGTASQGFSVTNNNGNGNGNQGNSNNNNNNGNSNSSNGFNLSAFGPLLVYGLIGGIVVFALLVALTVGVIVIAVTLRRLPKPPKGGWVCSACQATAPAGSKFCPNCAAPLGPPKK